MKKVFIIVAILLATATTITIVSCKKDKENEKSNNTENSFMHHELSDMDKAMIAFGEKIKTAAEKKDAVTMPLSDGLNTLSNYQNFTLCNASINSYEMIKDTISAKLNVTDGAVQLSDLYGIYESTRTEILAKFNSLTGSPKTIYLIKTSIADNSQNAVLNNFTGVLDVNVISYMVNSVNDTDLQDSFGSTDFWDDFEYGGKCDIYDGQCVGRDCVTELNSMLHFRMPDPTNIPGYSVYLTNIEFYKAYATAYPDSSSPNGYYAWPWRSFWSDLQCVSPSEMNYYLNAIEDDIDDLKSEYYYSLVQFYLGEQQNNNYNHNKDSNYHWESYLDYVIAEINTTPLPND